MVCVSCFTTWTDLEDFYQHVEAHGLLASRVNQAASEREVKAYNRWEFHTLENCRCRVIGLMLECEAVRPQR